MPREKVGDLTTEGRYVQVNWRRDEDEPGYVQVSTHGPDGRGAEYVHLDAEGLDRMIRTLHKAKRQAFGPDGHVHTLDCIRNSCRIPTKPAKFDG